MNRKEMVQRFMEDENLINNNVVPVKNSVGSLLYKLMYLYHLPPFPHVKTVKANIIQNVP
jgi:hypothetical protein